MQVVTVNYLKSNTEYNTLLDNNLEISIVDTYVVKIRRDTTQEKIDSETIKKIIGDRCL